MFDDDEEDEHEDEFSIVHLLVEGFKILCHIAIAILALLTFFS